MVADRWGGEYDYPGLERVGNPDYPGVDTLGNMITLRPSKVGNPDYPGFYNMGNLRYPRQAGDDELIEMAIAATESLIYLATLDTSAGLIVSRFDGSSWSDLGYTFDADPTNESVAIGADENRLVLFSRDATTLEGVVSEYDGDWSVLPQSEDTTGLTSSLNLRQLRIDTFANRIFAGFVDGTAFGLSASVGIYR